jgi:hypothetical protein
MTAVQDPIFVDALEQRLSRLMPDARRVWGTMTPHEMLCHLSDSFRGMLGERHVSSANWSRLRRTVFKWVAFHTPLPWPRGIPTLAEVNPHRAGTKPDVFERDREQLLLVMRRFVAADSRYAPHPMFGELTRDEWMIWTFRHVDHHLRQFGQ